MKEKMENTSTTFVTLSSPTVVSKRSYSSYPDYSEHFEPTADIIRHIPANSETLAREIPDFSDYFEPIASSTQRLCCRNSHGDGLLVILRCEAQENQDQVSSP
jgi:hypothetical protein